MKTSVKIIDEHNEITRVHTISGATAGEDKFIDRIDLGDPGMIISVPEFWVEDTFSESAKQYESKKTLSAPQKAINIGDTVVFIPDGMKGIVKDCGRGMILIVWDDGQAIPLVDIELHRDNIQSFAKEMSAPKKDKYASKPPSEKSESWLVVRCRTQDKSSWVRAAAGKKLSQWVVEKLKS